MDHGIAEKSNIKPSPLGFEFLVLLESIRAHVFYLSPLSFCFNCYRTKMPDNGMLFLMWFGTGVCFIFQ